MRKTKRKGLRAAKDGLRAQRLERFNSQRKKYEEMDIKERNKGKEESKKSKGKVLKVSNESMFKSPTKSKSNIASLLNSSTGDVFNTSGTQLSQTELSPGMQHKFDLIGDQLMATNMTSEALPTGNASKKRKLAEVIK